MSIDISRISKDEITLLALKENSLAFEKGGSNLAAKEIEAWTQRLREENPERSKPLIRLVYWNNISETAGPAVQQAKNESKFKRTSEETATFSAAIEFLALVATNLQSAANDETKAEFGDLLEV